MAFNGVKRVSDSQGWDDAPSTSSSLFAKEYDRAMNKTLYERGEISKEEYYKSQGFILEDVTPVESTTGIESILTALGISNTDMEIAKANLVKLLVPGSDIKSSSIVSQDTTQQVVTVLNDDTDIDNKIENLVEDVLAPKQVKQRTRTLPVVDISTKKESPPSLMLSSDIVDTETLNILDSLVDDELSRL